MGAAERVGFTYEDGLMGEDVIQEYEALAQNNIGLMITQSLVISPEDAVACGFPVPGIYKPEHVMPLKRIVDAAHKNGSVLIAQLGIAIPYSPRWSTKDIEDLLTRYLYSAKLCIEAGVDGIEIQPPQASVFLFVHILLLFILYPTRKNRSWVYHQYSKKNGRASLRGHRTEFNK